jgi:lipopolysaccharide transport system permease protein
MSNPQNIDAISTTGQSNTDENWDLIIKPQSSLLDIPWRDIWRYRDLLYMFVKRDVITVYKQTILGPIWFVVQPILTTAIYIVVFGNIAQISTDGMPKVLFYLSGIVIWNYFAESFNQTATTFKTNAAIFGKVYFPRLISPIAKVASALIKFFIQFAFLMVVYFYFILSGNESIHPNMNILLIPLYVIMMAGLGLGFGIVFYQLDHQVQRPYFPGDIWSSTPDVRHTGDLPGQHDTRQVQSLYPGQSHDIHCGGL